MGREMRTAKSAASAAREVMLLLGETIGMSEAKATANGVPSVIRTVAAILLAQVWRK
jgi:hypothetical protein